MVVVVGCGGSTANTDPGDNPCPTSAPTNGTGCTTTRACYYHFDAPSRCKVAYCEKNEVGSLEWTFREAAPTDCK